MRDIYGLARRVYFWLGEGTQESDEAMEWVVEASRCADPFTAIRTSGFPANMQIGEIKRIARMIPDAVGKFDTSCFGTYF
jgi:hypothetical protein